MIESCGVVLSRTDPSLIQHYPNFNARLRDSLHELVGGEVEKKVEIGLAKDGSGVGGTSFAHGYVSWLTRTSDQPLCALCRPPSKDIRCSTDRSKRSV